MTLDIERPKAPRWVKAFGVVTLILIGIFIALHVAGLGFGRSHGR